MGWCGGAHVAYALDGRYVLLFSFFALPSPTMVGSQFYISLLRLKKGRALMGHLPFSSRRSPFPLSGVPHRFPWDDGSSEHVSVTISQIYTLCTHGSSLLSGTDREKMVVARIFWYAYVHEGMFPSRPLSSPLLVFLTFVLGGCEDRDYKWITRWKAYL